MDSGIPTTRACSARWKSCPSLARAAVGLRTHRRRGAQSSHRPPDLWSAPRMRESRFDPGRLAAIYAGGVAGALARVGLAEAAPHGAASWPWATFAANMAGALLLGCFVSALRGHREESGG